MLSVCVCVCTVLSICSLTHFNYNYGIDVQIAMIDSGLNYLIIVCVVVCASHCLISSDGHSPFNFFTRLKRNSKGCHKDTDIDGVVSTVSVESFFHFYLLNFLVIFLNFLEKQYLLYILVYMCV